MISHIRLSIFLKFLKQIGLASQLPLYCRLGLSALKEQVLKLVLDHWQFTWFRLLLCPLPSCLLVHRNLEIQVGFTQLLLKVHALWFDKLHLIPLLHDLHHFLDIFLWVQVIDNLYLPFIV